MLQDLLRRAGRREPIPSYRTHSSSIAMPAESPFTTARREILDPAEQGLDGNQSQFHRFTLKSERELSRCG